MFIDAGERYLGATDVMMNAQEERENVEKMITEGKLMITEMQLMITERKLMITDWQLMITERELMKTDWQLMLSERKLMITERLHDNQ